ncbi:hypothetical protein BVC80_1819g1 [Macleaya cordata]|uniref:Uncharacterized protein n=1 Tax=Macleaya cordata TaxID=56857 RepID=A0A200QW49_MACCD|nr:hypothetical protein BVC80_9079g113 [Macleaya cordata]OVA14689.1 hypothetical protein BVC80_1819g1 [Macleaya cordata]
MPRSSRHKSHKQHKHSSKDSRDQSDSDEGVNLKERNGKEKALINVSKDSSSSEKRKLSQSQDSKHLFGPGNGDLSVEHGTSKRRKEKVDGTATDRWNGGDILDKETKGESTELDLDKGTKSKVSVDSKSKSSRRHESSSERKSDNRHESFSERKSENPGLVVESEEAKKNNTSSTKVEQKIKSEKDLGKKEGHEGKEKEHRSERDKKNQDVRRESKIDTLPGTATVKRELENAGKVFFTFIMATKRWFPDLGYTTKDTALDSVLSRPWNTVFLDTGHKSKTSCAPFSTMILLIQRQTHNELRNPELEKELEKRIRRRRDDSDDKDKYQDDSRDAKDSRVSSRDDRTRNGRYKDEKHKDDKYRDRNHEDLRKDHRNRDDKRRDDYVKDHTGHRSDTKHSRDEKQSPQKKSKPQDREGDGSPRIDDRVTSYKDNRGKKRSSDDNEEYSDLKSRTTKEHRSVVEKKSMSSSKKESPADRGRTQSRHADIDSTLSRSRRKSPSPSTYFSKDQFRSSSKAESNYKDSVSEERLRPNATPSRDRPSVPGVSERASESRSLEKLRAMTKPSKEDENHLAEFSAERSPISDRQASPAQLIEKSHSSTSTDRRYSTRTNVKRSLDMEETGRRSSGFRDAKDYSGNDERGSREPPLEKPGADEFSQADGDTVSVSSSFNRNSHFPSSSSSIIPPAPAFRIGVGSPSVLGSTEEDSRGKSRYRRPGDFNMGRGQGNAWKGVPNWPSPLPNGFIPFQHGPPGGFHTMMQQFPAPTLFGGRSSMELNHNGIPYHMPDVDRFSAHMHGWDGSNGIFGDESHIYGRPDWDQNRHVMNGRGWEVNSDTWKGQNSPSVPEKDDYLSSASADNVWAGQPVQRSRNERNRPGFRAESIEVKRSNDTPPTKDPTEAVVKCVREKTPEPSKMSNDNDAQFCHVYLSKLDISVDLTDPELYKQCMSLFDVDGNSTDDDIMKHAHLEEPRERLKISNATLSASLFPTLKDTVLQRAMTLYKKQGEETKAKLPFSYISGSEPECASTNDCDKLYPFGPFPTLSGEKPETLSAINGVNLEKIPPSAQEIAEEPNPTQMMVEEPIPAQMIVEESVQAQTMVEETVPAKMMVEEPIPQMMVEEPVPAQLMVEEPVPSQMMVEEQAPAQMMVEEPVTASDHEKVEKPVLNSDQEKAEEPVPISDQEKEEEPIANSVEVVELVLAPDEEIPEEVVVPTSDHQEKVEAALNAVDRETLEESVEDQSPLQISSQTNTDGPSNEEAIVISSDSEGNGSAGTADELDNKAFNGTIYDPLGFTNISSEVCEALTPESIECRSVNLSRIHNSSESTH